jgi:hypothetical protein
LFRLVHSHPGKSVPVAYIVAYILMNNKDSTRYAAVALGDVTKLPIFPSTSRTNVADFLLHSAVEETFIRQIAVVTDTK